MLAAVELSSKLCQFPTTAYRDDRTIERHGDCYASPHRIQVQLPTRS